MNQDIDKCVEVLRAGGLILYPTDTIWGIGCDATSEAAVRRVFELKRRASEKSLIVLLDAVEHLSHYVVDVPPMALELQEVAVEPLTIVYEGAYNLAPSVLGPADSVGIRVPREEFSHRLCKAFGRPIVSTSANVSGAPAPTTFGEIADDILNGVDYVVNYRQTDNAPARASNVILLRSDGTFKIIR